MRSLCHSPLALIAVAILLAGCDPPPQQAPPQGVNLAERPVPTVAIAPVEPPKPPEPTSVAQPVPVDAPAVVQAASVEPTKPKYSLIDKSGTLQRERKAMIRDLVAKGVFREPEKSREDTVRVTVTRRFLSLDFDQKQAFIGVVYAYYFDTTDERNMVILREVVNDKIVGRYSTVHAGLHMD